MNIFSENNLAKWIVALPIVGIAITAFIFTALEVAREKSAFDDKYLSTKSRQINFQKDAARGRVITMAAYIKSQKNMHLDHVKERIKERVDDAISIIESVYANSIFLSRDETLSQIKKKLRDIRFWEGTGYYFIYDLEGNCILLPPSPQLENTNLLEFQDIKGKFTIKDSIKSAKERSKSFVRWWWHKPGETQAKEKFGYVKIFEELGIFVGTAKYREDIVAEVQESAKKFFLSELVQESKREAFVLDLNGKNIETDKQVVTKDEVLSIKKGMKYAPEGFFLSKTASAAMDIEKMDRQGYLYVYYTPELDWIVGEYVYRHDTIKDISQDREEILKEFNEIVIQKILVSIIIVFLMTVVALVLAYRLKKVLKNYKRNLEQNSLTVMKQKEVLQYSLRHDHLTSLPNKILFNDRLKQVLKHSRRTSKKAAVMFIDIDKFKDINDSLGHDAGDMLLKEVALRLKEAIRDSDTVARFGGDEFVVLIDDFKSLHDVVTIILKIRKTFLPPVKTAISSSHVTLSIGVSIFPEDGDSAIEIIKNADIAMYKAKSDGRDCYRFFTMQMNREIQEHLEIEKELREAVKNREFVLHYQPLVEAKTAKILGVEALVRWEHPTQGIVFPDKFISIAEDSKIMIDLGNLILEEAMSQMTQWKERGYTLGKMSINIAAGQLEDPDFIKNLKKLLKKNSCKPEWIEIEIIERYAMKDIQRSIIILNELRKIGIDVALDDFGTGYSSLAYLRELPVTKLKIDRAFVKNIISSYEDRAIAEAIIALASGLKMKVLAEGVEQEKEREFLVLGGCNEMQGYFFSKPLPADKVEKLLEKGVCPIVV